MLRLKTLNSDNSICLDILVCPDIIVCLKIELCPETKPTVWSVQLLIVFLCFHLPITKWLLPIAYCQLIIPVYQWPMTKKYLNIISILIRAWLERTPFLLNVWYVVLCFNLIKTFILFIKLGIYYSVLEHIYRHRSLLYRQTLLHWLLSGNITQG